MKTLKIKEMSKFKKILLLYAIIFIFILTIALIIFNLFLKSYENSQPIHAVRNYIENLNNKEIEILCDSLLSNVNEKIQTKDDCINNISDIFSNCTYAYNATDSNSEKKYYVLQYNNKTIVNLELTKGKEDLFGYAPWEICNSQLIEENISNTINIKVPNGYTIKINENELDNSFITNKNSHFGMLDGFYKDFENLPTVLEYKIGPYVGDINVAVYNLENAEVTNVDFENFYYLDNCTEEEKNSLKTFSQDFVERYVNFTTGTDYNTSGRLDYLMEIVDSNSILAEKLEYTMGLGMVQEHSDTIQSINIDKFMNCDNSIYCVDISYDVETISKSGDNNITYGYKLLIEKKYDDTLIAIGMSVE